MFLYALIYWNKQGDYVYSLVMAENHIVANRKAIENVKLWEGFDVYSVNFLDKDKLESGEIVFVGGKDENETD